LKTLEPMVQAALPRRARWDPATRDAAVGFAQDILLGPFLDEHLSEPFRDRVRERLTRGWDAAVDQPRYGPNGSAVAAAIAGIAGLPAAELRRVATAAAAADPVGRSGPIWPKGLRPDEDDALRVSSELARRDIVAALPAPIPAAARRSLERATHALVLRHAFPAAVFEEMLGAWRGPFGLTAAPRPSVRGEPRPNVRCDRRPRA
jgi:hypothetical protein